MEYIKDLNDVTLKPNSTYVINLPSKAAYRKAIDDLSKLGYYWSDGSIICKDNYRIYDFDGDPTFSINIYTKTKTAYICFVNSNLLKDKNNWPFDYRYTKKSLEQQGEN